MVRRMSKLTLSEAIKHCLEVAESNYELADKFDAWDEWEKADADNCRECAADHRQFAEWLTELKELRTLVAASNVLAKDVLAVDTLCKQILEYKRLLKLAVEDFSNVDYHIYECDMDCDTCPLHGERDNCLVWRYADEALKLLEDEPNGI